MTQAPRAAGAGAPEHDDKLPGGGQFFRYVVDNAADGFFVIDEQRRFIDANAALCRMFNSTRAEILGKTPLDLVAVESHAELIAQIRSIETTEHRRYRLLAQRKDGTKFPILLNNTSYRDSSGNVAGSFGFITDLTSLVEAQQAVAASERELQGILDNMQDTYYRTDAGGRVVRASRSVFNLLGYKPEEVLGKPLADLYFDPADRQDFLQRMAEQGGTLSGYDSRLRHKAGHEVWVLTNSQYLRAADGKVVGVEGTTRDNTEHRRSEAHRFPCHHDHSLSAQSTAAARADGRASSRRARHQCPAVHKPRSLQDRQRSLSHPVGDRRYANACASAYATWTVSRQRRRI
jgi:PAS domain S-box-containing protein